jgi:O-methyltransferase
VNRLTEPYFEDRLFSLTGASAWTKADEIIWNQSRRQTQKHEFYQHAFEFISDNKIEGDYHEFGCHRCRTFRMAMQEAQRHFLVDTRFYAYDSFRGLPPSDSSHGVNEKWSVGQLSTSKASFLQLITSSGYSLDQVTCFEGYYDTLLPSLDHAKFYGRNASLVTVDCDLYESSLPVFQYLEYIIQEGTILYIDDYFTGYKGNPEKGVSKALSDWLSSTSWKICDYRDVGWAGKSFILYP